VTTHTVLCQAIGSRTLLTFDYNGKPRIVAPYCYGVTAKNVEVLRAIQVGGESQSGGYGFGKLWHVAKMQNIRNTTEPFVATDPDYNPDDHVMARIHCRI
jgi:hypothetical protein